jgi:hypothetical protein
MAFDQDGNNWDDEFRAGPRQQPLPPPPPVPSPEDDGFGRTVPTIPGDPGYDPQPTPTGGNDPVDFGSFELPGYSGPFRPQIDIGAAPQFRPDMFQGIGFDDAMNEPGFQFRLKAGSDALERSAAARGVLRTGTTLKDLVDYNQSFAANEYQNVYNRALQAYLTRYQAQRDMFAPHLAEWQQRANAEQQSGLAAFQLPYNIWSTQVDSANRNEDRIANTALPRPPADASY